MTRTRSFADRILAHYKRPVIDLAAAFERRLPPPGDFLRWLLQHPTALDNSPPGYGASGDNRRKREQLFGADREASERAMAIGLAELDARGAAGSDKQWWAFEGFSAIDCCLVTPTTVLFIEGKRTDRVSASTAWYSTRHQLWRYVEVASVLAGDRQYGVMLAVEDELQGHLDLVTAMYGLEVSYPHLTDDRRKELERHFLGFITWKELQMAFALPPSCLPDTVEDVLADNC